MKARNILILSALVVVVIILTVAEKYRGYQQRVETEAAAAREREEWETRLNRMFDARWRDLSTEARNVLDSLARSLLAEAPATPAAGAAPTEIEPEATPETTQTSGGGLPLAVDSLPQQVVATYESALSALPADLSDYERRVAVDEVGFLVRTRFELSESVFDSLLQAASP